MTSSEQRDAIRELVPLYVNGALSGPDRARFEMRMQHDAALRTEVDELAEIEAAFRAEEERLAIDLDAVFSTVRNRIRRQSSSGRHFRRAAVPLAARLRELLREPATGWAVAAAQLAVIAVLLTGIRPETRPVETLSESTPREQTQSRRIHVVFSPAATQEQMRSLLARLGARIVDGPNEVGAYTVELRGQGDRAQAIATLRASEIVVFAEIAY